jgi:hypothetical protein
LEKNLILATWSWLVISILLEVVAAQYLSARVSYLRGAVESLLALSAVVPLMLVYMGLRKEHISLKMFVVVALFFCADLLFIWSASVVH